MVKKKSGNANLGIHTSISPSILHGLQYAYALGASAVQIFTGPNITASLKAKHKLTPDEIKETRNYLKLTGIILVIHAVYVLNFCSYPANSGRIQYAHHNLEYDMNLAQQLGGRAVVLHLGNQMLLSRETAISNMVDNIIQVLINTSQTAPDICLALETPAGQGSQICTTLDELGELWQQLKLHPKWTDKMINRVGFCVDTAHIFSSGIDIRTPAKLKEYLRDFDRVIGLKNIRVIHLNDSKRGLGSRRDLHEGLGAGHIFGEDKCMSVVRELVKFGKQSSIPIILETHSAGSRDNPDGELYAQELGLLNAFNDGYSRAGCDWRLQQHKSSLGRKSTSLGANILLDGKTLKKNKSLLLHSNKSKKTGKKIKSNDLAYLGLGNPANLGLLNKIRELKDYYTLVEPDKIRALAYGKALLTIKNYPEEIMNGQQIAHLPGIGAKMVKKVNEYLTNGEMDIFKELKVSQKLEYIREKAKYDISAVLGIGPAKASILRRQGIYTVNDLQTAVNKDIIKLNKQEAMGLKYHNDLIKKIPRKEAEGFLYKITKHIKQYNGGKFYKKWRPEIELAGSYPSGKLESKDIDILIFTPKIRTVADLKDKGNDLMMELSDLLVDNGIQVELYSRGESKLLVLAHLGDKYPVRHIDIRLIPTESAVFGRLYFTSGRDFNQVLRMIAKKKGLKLNEFGLYRGSTVISGLETEADIMSAIGVPFVPMEKRR